MTNAHKYSSRSSMDDILSSIRRIIDESVSSDGEPERASARPAPETIHPAPQTIHPVPTAFEAPVEPVRPPELLSNEPVTPKVAPVASDINGHSATAPTVDTHDHRFTPDDAVAFREVAEVLQSTASILHAQDDEEPTKVDEQVAELEPDSVEIDDSIVVEAETTGVKVPPDTDTSKQSAEPEAVNAAPPAPTAEPHREPVTPLVSSATSRSIAQTLAALDEVLKERTGEDLKSTTEEMLKPMLAEWLDENLPSMVERLVRQEIERIARGEPRAA